MINKPLLGTWNNLKHIEKWIGQVEFTGNTGTPCRTRMGVMDLGFSALCIVLRKTCMACIAAPETYEESHWCISTASYRRWRSCGSRGTTQVPMIPWWEHARTLTQQNADLKSDLNVQQILQWWKKHSKCASHILFSQHFGRAKAEKISWSNMRCGRILTHLRQVTDLHVSTQLRLQCNKS